MFWHSFHVVVILGLLASVARFSALKIVVATLGALPAAGGELAVLALFLGLHFVGHVLLTPVTGLASLEVVVEALVAVPSALWEFEGVLTVFTGGERLSLELEGAGKRVE